MKLIFVIITLLGIFPLLGEDWTPKISIKNGSTGTVGKADTIKLIALDSGMKPVGEYKEKVGEFTLPKINIPDGAPILIQAIYKGVNYNKMVPPAPQFRSKVQEVIVYEKTNSTKDLEVQSLIQIIRLKNFLNIHKVFLLNNKSNFSIDNPSELQVFIPKSAQNLSIQLTQGKKGMPIPLNLEDGDKGRVINRAILPGESNLQFSYLIESDEGKETIIEELPIIEQSESQVIFLKPDDMKLKSEGADYNKIEDNDVPEGMGVYSIKISRNKSYKIVISGGSVVEENHSAPRGPNVVNGTIFTTTEKSIFGVIAVLALLISLSFIFIYRKKQ